MTTENQNATDTTDIAGVRVSTRTKPELLAWIEKRMVEGKQTFLATPYGEFLYEALRNPEFKWILNEFDANIADGISVQWASVFLKDQKKELFFETKRNLLKWWWKICKITARMMKTGSLILLSPRSIRTIIPEKITGSDFIWDLAEMAEKNNWSVMLAGGFGDTAEITKNKLLEKFPKLNVVGTSSLVIPDKGVRQLADVTAIRDPRFKTKNMNSEYPPEAGCGMTEKENAEIARGGEAVILLHQIQTLKPDVLLLCLGPFKQERFLIYNREKLPVKLAIGLGGTFDYIAGKKKQPPRLIRDIGLEWLWRLLTQPERLKRIYNATFSLVISLIKYKVYQSRPYRPNVAIAIFTPDDEILICRRKAARKPVEWPKHKRPESWFFDHWQFPQGKIEAGESPEQGAMRETEEEVGIKQVKILQIIPNIRNYIFPADSLGLLTPNKYKGQSQSLALLRYEGDKRAVRVDQDEFDEYDWVRKEDLINRLHPARKDLGKLVLENWPLTVKDSL